MCGLGHQLENAGVATVVLGLIPQHVEAIRPPRALLVPFELGRPLGAPDAPALQRAVLEEALALAGRNDVPVVAEYSERVAAPAPGFDAQGWACPVSFTGAGEPDAVDAEVSALLPWYDRFRQDRGRTTLGLSGYAPIEIAGRLRAALTDDAVAQTPDGREPGEYLKSLVEDLKAFYFEATLAQPGHPDGPELQRWFWTECAGGQLIRELRDRLKQSDDERLALLAAFTFVPFAQLRD